MKHILTFLFGRRKRRVIEVPDAFGRRLTSGEIKAAFAQGRDTALLCAIGQLLYYRSVRLTDAGRKDAWKGQDTRFQLGGANAIEELIDDIEMLVAFGKVPEDLEEFFKDT